MTKGEYAAYLMFCYMHKQDGDLQVLHKSFWLNAVEFWIAL
jgi:hypothetical protein